RGLRKVLAHKYKEDWNRREKDINLLEQIGKASESLSVFLSEYILDPSLETGIKSESDPEDCVILSTIHSAKGLEARNCYLVNANFTQYPSSRAVANGEDAIEEDRRCLYVALTRAKDRLIIYRTHRAVQVIDPSDIDSFEASKLYFFNDIPENLYSAEFLGGNTKDWGFYTGSGLTLTDCDEFDFS
ncbi:MAG: ATP-binding domain-containing protein, partial [Muribaculaceae bacterium]|nr:ATP-binding domain-containing protein [Muribaculaceae bacterium]